MVNFKIGDVVRVFGKPETLRTIVDVPLEYATLPWATSPSRVWLDNGGWIYITELELVAVDDELPPAPESVQYIELTGSGKPLATLHAFQHHLGDGIVVHTQDVIKLTPDEALQLCHDLRRMAMEIKRKEKQNG